jgi:hypothetical protein
MLTAGVALAMGVTFTTAAEPQTEAAGGAVAYIESLQNADGGFPAFGAESSPGATLDVAFALAAVEEDAADVAAPGGTTLGEYLAAQTAPPDDPGALAKLSYGLSVIGLDGGALVDVMHQYIDPQTDGYGDDVFDQAFYVFALAAADGPLPGSAAYMRSVQVDDGGWEFAPGFGSDSNTTAMALQALLAAGGSRDEQATLDALAYLKTAQNDDGGVGFTATDESDPNSTALVVQALVAAGEDIDEGGPWAPGGNTPIEALLSFRNEATGAFQYAGSDSAFATYQAVPALMLAPFPGLETLPDGGAPLPAATATGKPSAPTPTPVSTVAGVQLPSAGQGGGADTALVAMLALVGAAAITAGVAMRRVR